MVPLNTVKLLINYTMDSARFGTAFKFQILTKKIDHI